ncbi:MAG TPA: glycoside hydrolase family 97 protein [Steroidobacteraceae bacterium]|nr:glycoside hydrolase family 97 protein [Steroidobacteraceae bacterium]
MSKRSSAAVCGLVFMLASAHGHADSPAAGDTCVSSPGEVLRFCVRAEANGPVYDVLRRTAAGERMVISHARLGLVLEGLGNSPATRIGDARRTSVDTSWEQPWGEQRVIQDRHNELKVTLSGNDAVLTEPYDLTVRMFDDGVGFRYEFQGIAADRDVAIVDELTEFRLPDGKGSPEFDAWWFPARHADRDEYLYSRTPVYAVNLAETPLTLQSPGLYLSIHEAALVDYASMNLRRTAERTLKADLMPWSDGVLVRKRGPFTTPWRTLLIGESPAALADSRIELNLNEPSKLRDVSWISPGKYVGIWWEMHLNRSTWASGDKHGANNANVRRYMDFAAKYGFGGVLVEGWNRGWDGDWIANGKHFSFTESYPDFDLPMLAAYGRKHGVRLIGHNETAGAVENYERQLEAAMAQYQANGVTVVKTGYVRPSGTLERTLADGGTGHEWFAGQFRVRHELKVAEVAAAHHIAIDAHEPVKDTGLRRTWPNMLSREGARGQEFNAWGRPTNPPEHLTILPFTRMLAGPMDFTPGIFDITFGKDDINERVQSTLATQLAEYVLLYSPVHMAADLPENYEKRRDAFQFILDVPTDWETSRTLAGEIGDYVVVARKQRGARDWFLGATTDENARKLGVPLDFLDKGKRYEAQIYRDAPDADYRTNPTALVIEKRVVTAKESLEISMAPGGGIAVRFRAL